MERFTRSTQFEKFINISNLLLKKRADLPQPGVNNSSSNTSNTLLPATPDFLTRRNNMWHFVRRVPTEFAYLDKRGVVKHSTIQRGSKLPMTEPAAGCKGRGQAPPVPARHRRSRMRREPLAGARRAGLRRAGRSLVRPSLPAAPFGPTVVASIGQKETL